MNTFAFLLDGRPFSSPPPVPMMLCTCLSPIAALIGCYLVARKRRFVGYAIGIAGLSTFLLVAPLYKVAFNYYDISYNIDDLMVLSFAITFPFLAIAVFYFYPPRSPDKPPEPTSETQL
jgi:hypothetical protein